MNKLSTFSSLSLSDAHIGGASNAGGWSDDDYIGSPVKSTGDGWDDDDFGTSSNSAAITSMNKDDDDDFFASFDSKPATRPVGRLSAPKKTGLSLTSKAAPGLKVKKPIKPAVKKLPSDLMDDGWDDF